MDLYEEIKNKQIVLVVLPKAQYINKLMEVVKAIDSVSKKICYVKIGQEGEYGRMIINPILK